MGLVALATSAVWPAAHVMATPPSLPHSAFVLDGDPRAVQASPSTLDFGSVSIGGTSATKNITVTATGIESVTIGAVSFDSTWDTAHFSIVSNVCTGVTLSPGQSCTIGVVARPVASYHLGALLIASNGTPSIQSVYMQVLGTDPVVLQVTPRNWDFGTVPVGAISVVKTITATATGSASVTIGTVAFSQYEPQYFGVVGDTCTGVTLAPGLSCTVDVVAHPRADGQHGGTLYIPSNMAGMPIDVRFLATGTGANQGPNEGTFYPRRPYRILDTREGTGAAKAPVGSGSTINLQVTAPGVIPAGVSAVVLNVTVTGPTTAGHITVFPTGVPMPTASSLNFVPGWTGANSVTVPLGAGGQVSLYNSAGKTHLIADLVGFYAEDNSMVPSYGHGGEFQPVDPERLFDSRVDWGQRLPSGHLVLVPANYGPEYSPHINALAVNVTAVDGTGTGYVTTFSGEGPVPNASTLNFTRGSVVPNFAVVPAKMCYNCGTAYPIPMIAIYTSVDVHLVVDIVGFYDDGQLADGTHDGLRFAPRTPQRITDSRFGFGMSGALGQQATASIAAPGGLPPATVALALNVTAVSPTETTFIAVWPNGLAMPTVSTLNPSRGQTIPNATVSLLGDEEQFNLYNNAGSVHIVIDMVGTFYFLDALDGARADARAGSEAFGSGRAKPELTKSGVVWQRA